MATIDPALRTSFEASDYAEIFDSIVDLWDRMALKQLDVIAIGAHDVFRGDKKTKINLALLRQTLLHRSRNLMASAVTAAANADPYGAALLSRAHIETTAVLGYFCNRIESLEAKNISAVAFSWDLADAIMGAKHELFAEARPPENVLTMIDKAQKYASKHFGLPKEDNIIRGSYDWLSEYAHPNYMSQASAFIMDDAKSSYLINHANISKPEHFQPIGYLDISAGLFIAFFEELERLAQRLFQDA